MTDDEMPMRSAATACIHAGQHPDPETGAVSVPISQSSTFAFDSADQGADLFAGRRKGYIYTRLGNPTTAALEKSVAYLEGGVGALATATGMAAVTTVYLTFLGQGAHMIGTASCYGPSRVVMETELARFGIAFDFVETSDLDRVRRALRPATRLILIETPANPTLRLTDIKACAALAHERNVLMAVDNTFCSPLLQKPLELGADIVIHSLTKFLNGHSDVVGGAIVAGNEETHRRLAKVLRQMGGTMDPHQAWLVLRGIRTLALRVEKAEQNAAVLARFLEKHPRVAWVNYPGLETHPDFNLARTQMKGFGSMISFGLKGGFQAGKVLINAVRLCTLAVSLGGVESLIQHPASMTHAGVPREEKEAAGITDDLIRLSVGCEGVEDIQADLAQALDKVA
jgi:methionine-gamma-lyase